MAAQRDVHTLVGDGLDEATQLGAHLQRRSAVNHRVDRLDVLINARHTRRQVRVATAAAHVENGRSDVGADLGEYRLAQVVSGLGEVQSCAAARQLHDRKELLLVHLGYLARRLCTGHELRLGVRCMVAQDHKALLGDLVEDVEPLDQFAVRQLLAECCDRRFAQARQARQRQQRTRPSGLYDEDHHVITHCRNTRRDLLADLDRIHVELFEERGRGLAHARHDAARVRLDVREAHLDDLAGGVQLVELARIQCRLGRLGEGYNRTHCAAQLD